MQVHERYFGRELKCTSCRAEFVAEMSAGSAPAPAVAAPQVSDSEEKSPMRFLVWLLVLIPLAGFVAWMVKDDGPPETAFRDQHVVGDVVSLDTGTTRPVLVALDQESVGALVDMRTGTIQLGVSSLMTKDESYLEVEAGTKAKLLAYANEDREAQVQLLEGQWANEKVWVPRRWLR
jgi:hypothetical protein